MPSQRLAGRRLVRLLVRMLSRGPFMRWFRTLRGWRDEYVDPAVNQLRVAVRQFRRGPVDVLFLGDSTQRWIGPDDVDGRRLPEMVMAELGPRCRAVSLDGGGYNAELYGELVRVLSTLPQRPKVVVLSLTMRAQVMDHVVLHPVHGHRRSIENVRRIPDADARLWSISARNRPRPEDFARFEAIEVTTRWQQARTIGDYLAKVRGHRLKPDDVDVHRALFDYFHGELVPADHPRLAHIAELGRRLRNYGVPVVQYWGPIPTEKGEEYFPGEFTQHVEANLAVCAKVFSEALGPLHHPLPQGSTRNDELIDCRDASEHWNDRGRLRIARMIADEIRAVTGEAFAS